MQPYQIIILIVGIILFLLLVYLLFGTVVIYTYLSKKSIAKMYKKNSELPNNPFWEQVDIKWFTDENVFKIIFLSSFDHHIIRCHLATNPKPSHKYVIYAHGWCGNPDEETKVCRDFYEKDGFNILSIEQRAQQKSEIKLCTMGIRESRDLLSWINYVIAQDDKAEIVLFGLSMGAGTVTMTNRFSLPPQVKCLIADAGYSSIYQVFRNTSEPIFGKFFSAVFISSAYIDLKIFYHLDIKKTSPEAALKNCKIPCLFIQGDKDQMVPFSSLDHNYQIVKRAGVYAEKEVFAGVLHGLCAVDDYARYYKITSEFINKFVK